MNKINTATINLFKGLEIQSKRSKVPSKELLLKTLKYGVIFTPQVIYNYSEDELVTMARTIGTSSKQLNSTFHKSWLKVRDTPMEQLVLEQIIHYMTTYGLESVGLYSKDTIFIPAEQLDALKTNIEFVVIKGYTQKELKEKLLSMLESGIALKQETITDVMEVATLTNLDSVDRIKNKEVKIALSVKLGIIPEDPVEFLRLAIFEATGKSLIIKDKKTIESIKASKVDSSKLFLKYKNKYGFKNLSSIFLRFKSLFLAFRKQDKFPHKMINDLRRLAEVNHKPMVEDYLNSVTKNIRTLKVKDLDAALSKANIFRKIRLLYALKFRTSDAESIMYRIRNGKSYSKEFTCDYKLDFREALDIVYKSIINDLNVKGKKIYIPKNLIYALPSTEKQFTGVVPSGTCISIPKDAIVGVHWVDVGNSRIDLDLSLTSISGKIGWDRSYRNNDSTILFSGDMTSAPKPNGASELFYIKKQLKEAYLLNLNYYNYNSAVEVPFNIVVASESAKDFNSNYVINPNNVLANIPTSINEKQKILGLLIVTTGGCRLYFAESYSGNSITTSESEHVKHSRQFLHDYYCNAVSLNKLLEDAGAKIISEPDKLFDIDLSLEAVSKDTIINLLLGGK